MFDLRRVRQDFPGTQNQVYLNAAGMSLPPRAATEKAQETLALLGQGPGEMGSRAYQEKLWGSVVAAREEAARLLGVAPEEIALVDDTTMGLNIALASIRFEPGDNVVLCDLEYPQVALTADHARRHFGTEIRVVPHRGGMVGVEDFEALIDAKTRAVLISSVQWVHGLRADLAAFSDLSKKWGFFLIVDAIQQLGAIPLDLSALHVDFLAAGGHKWLNAPFGVGLLYASRRVWERTEPGMGYGLFALAEPEGGWERALSDPGLTPFLRLPLAADARRFDISGMPKVVGGAGFGAALAYLNQLDRKEAAEHILGLGDWLIEELKKRGFRVWTPAAKSLRSGIVTFDPCGQGDGVHRLVQELGRERIYLSARYCSGVGGVRVSVHFYNSREDLEKLLSVMDAVLRRL